MICMTMMSMDPKYRGYEVMEWLRAEVGPRSPKNVWYSGELHFNLNSPDAETRGMWKMVPRNKEKSIGKV